MTKELTVIIPAYNEEAAIGKVLAELFPTALSEGWKIIVVDDASKDSTHDIAARAGTGNSNIEVIRHRRNLGYGAAVKTGVKHSTTDWVATFDADGQHPAAELLKLSKSADDADAVIGVRTRESASTAIRVPGKLALKALAKIITGIDVPDINCGLRVIRRKALLKIFGLTCDGFSFSTSTLFALLNMGFYVKYELVTTRKRIGESTVRQVRHGLETILLILRLITLFNPLRIFLPVAATLATSGFLWVTASFLSGSYVINKFALLTILSGIFVFFFALLQDQISSLRRELSSFEADFEDRQ